MNNSSIPPEWYAVQAELAAKELDFDLHLAACEAEIKSGISVTFQPIETESETQQPDNSVYNLNAILDGLL